MNACVGETVFLPSFFPVSPLGNNEVAWSKASGSLIIPAENGVTTANYSYKIINVNMSDVGTYRAGVKAPHQNLEYGPQIMLVVKEKPCK